MTNKEKLILKTVVLAIYWLILLGFVAPFMVSSTDNELVIGGFILILISIGLSYIAYRKQIKTLWTGENHEENNNNST